MTRVVVDTSPGDTVVVDGKEILAAIPEIQPVNPPDRADYDEDGWSFEPDEYGASRNYDVDMYLATLRAGDEYEQQIASEADPNFACVIPGRDYSNDQMRVIKLNHNKAGGPKALTLTFGRFYPDAVFDKDKGQTILGEALESYCTPARGFEGYEVWAETAEGYIRHLAGEITRRRRGGSPVLAGPPKPPDITTMPPQEGGALIKLLNRVGGLARGTQQAWTRKFIAGESVRFNFKVPEIADGRKLWFSLFADFSHGGLWNFKLIDPDGNQFSESTTKVRKFFRPNNSGEIWEVEITSERDGYCFMVGSAIERPL